MSDHNKCKNSFDHSSQFNNDMVLTLYPPPPLAQGQTPCHLWPMLNESGWLHYSELCWMVDSFVSSAPLCDCFRCSKKKTKDVVKEGLQPQHYVQCTVPGLDWSHKNSVYANPSPLHFNYLGELMNSNGNIYTTSKLETFRINGDGIFYALSI